MCSSNKLLRRKTPQNGIGRKEYIEHLVEEFHTTTNVEAQEQVTANLANFAYDPFNFQFLRESFAVELFLQLLVLPNDRLILHGITGVANICLDPVSRVEITKAENLNLIFRVFQSTHNTEVAINLLTLFYLLLPEDESLKQQICTSKNLQRIHYFKNSSEERLKALATISLEEFAILTVENKDQC